MKKLVMILVLSSLFTELNFAEENQRDNDIALYTFFVNVVNENFPFPLIGFVNIAGGNQHLPQIGFANVNQNNFSTLQAGFLNIVGGDMTGFQWSFTNILNFS